MKQLRPLSLACALAAAAWSPAFGGNDPNECDVAGEEPDVIVGDLPNVDRWGRVGDITGYSVATTSCNLGTCWLDWLSGTNENRHPVIAQAMFKLRNGRFEQIGQSWVKHGFFAVNGNLCESGCEGTNGDHLGVNCSDPYSAFLNGDQDRLGPKFEVNAATGFHPHPVTDINDTGNAIFKRLQVRDADIDPDLNSGALYFVEGQYVARDDALAGNQLNNSSYREVEVDEIASSTWEVNVVASTQREQPAIRAWAAEDPTVEVDVIDVPGDGRLLLGARVTDLGGGVWHYEYALQNQTSDRAAQSFAVPIPGSTGVTNIGFRDVPYHSGEPFDGTDWTPAVGASALTWSTVPFAVNANSNALRWGTLYNFRFDLNRPPVHGALTIGLFKPGTPGSVEVDTWIPTVCNENSICSFHEECFCPLDCPPEGSDLDGDGVGQCIDCAEQNASLWGTPGEVVGGAGGKTGTGTMVFSWSPPLDPGATTPSYEVIRSSSAAVFTGPGVVCVSDAVPTDLSATDAQVPLPTKLFFYLVRATNGCAQGDGSLGTDSAGNPRVGRSCP